MRRLPVIGDCRRPAAPLGLFLSALLAGCQPLPQPFAEHRPPAALLQIRGSESVSIAPIEGRPEAVAAKLGAATAGALLKREIPASDKTTGRGSYLLYGRVVESQPRDGKAAVTALWRLYDPKGETIGERRVRLEAAPADWQKGTEPAVERLAALSAAAVAPLLVEEAPKAAAAPAEDRRVRVAVRKVGGAPGDGGSMLTAAVAAVLRRQEVAVVAEGDKADLYVEGEVAVQTVKPNTQHVKILWRVRRADGAEIGTVGQENDVPRGMLDEAWGEIAYNVAVAASEGLAQLIARGAASRKS